MRRSQENTEPLLFNKNLKFLREKNHLAALRMSKILNIAWSTYVAYETVTWPRPDTLIAISEYFNVSIDDLIKKDLSILEENESKTAPDAKERVKELETLLQAKEETIQSQKDCIETQKSLIEELKAKKG
jgi:transcriptional regulator with XRE-family HTH domain